MMPLMLKLCCQLIAIIEYYLRYEIKINKFESLLVVSCFARLLHPSTVLVLYILHKK